MPFFWLPHPYTIQDKISLPLSCDYITEYCIPIVNVLCVVSFSSEWSLFRRNFTYRTNPTIIPATAKAMSSSTTITIATVAPEFKPDPVLVFSPGFDGKVDIWEVSMVCELVVVMKAPPNQQPYL